MNKKQIRQMILEILLEVIQDVHNYAPDKWEKDLEYTLKDKLKLLKGESK